MPEGHAPPKGNVSYSNNSVSHGKTLMPPKSPVVNYGPPKSSPVSDPVTNVIKVTVQPKKLKCLPIAGQNPEEGIFPAKTIRLTKSNTCPNPTEEYLLFPAHSLFAHFYLYALVTLRRSDTK